MSKEIAKEIISNILDQYNKSLHCIRLENNKLQEENRQYHRLRINYNTGRIDQQSIMISDLLLIEKELNCK